MKFDITNIDKRSLLKALYSLANNIGLGSVEYETRKIKGENVDKLSDCECDELLREFNVARDGLFRIADYLNGKSIKIIFYKSKKGRITVSTDGYDSLNGIYSFLNCMLKNFPRKEILITKKWSSSFILKPSKSDYFAYNRYDIFITMLKNTIEKRNEYGRYWEIQEEHLNKLKEFDCTAKL